MPPGCAVTTLWYGTRLLSHVSAFAYLVFFLAEIVPTSFATALMSCVGEPSVTIRGPSDDFLSENVQLSFLASLMKSSLRAISNRSFRDNQVPAAAPRVQARAVSASGELPDANCILLASGRSCTRSGSWVTSGSSPSGTRVRPNDRLSGIPG